MKYVNKFFKPCKTFVNSAGETIEVAVVRHKLGATVWYKFANGEEKPVTHPMPVKQANALVATL